jgi:hypothetical protein
MKVNVRAGCGTLVFVAALAAVPYTTIGVGAASPATVFVSNSNDDGPGSFRRAIATANADPRIARIQFLGHVSTIHLRRTIEFSGAQDLTIAGAGATLDGSRAPSGSALLASGGGDLSVSNFNVRNAKAQGIEVQVPPAATGTVRLSLFNVNIVNNLGHGVLVNDQEDDSTPEEEQPPANGSAASVDVTVVNCRFVHNGYSVSDRDGLRVNEGGDGDLTITVKLSQSEDNGADGIEVDERGTGNVNVEMFGVRLTGNGPFDTNDLDDGFDIDEWDAGSIVGTVVLSLANNNHEEGFDFNENNDGDLRVTMQLVEANGNGEEGIDLEEDDDFGNSGDLVTVMNTIVTIGNGNGADGALKIREKETGNLDVTLTNVFSANNFGSGIFVRESSGGSSLVRISRALTFGNKLSFIEDDDEFVGGHGIEILESGGGDLMATVSKSNSSGNEAFGVFGDEDGGGAGTVTLAGVTFIGSGNTLGETGGRASFIIQP